MFYCPCRFQEMVLKCDGELHLLSYVFVAKLLNTQGRCLIFFACLFKRGIRSKSSLVIINLQLIL